MNNHQTAQEQLDIVLRESWFASKALVDRIWWRDYHKDSNQPVQWDGMGKWWFNGI